jgi:hypothetical protein
MEDSMATYSIGVSTVSQGQSAYWWWNYNGPSRGAFAAEAIPVNTSENFADLRTHDLGYESTFNPENVNGVFYTAHAVVTSWSGHAQYTLVVGDFL